MKPARQSRRSLRLVKGRSGKVARVQLRARHQRRTTIVRRFRFEDAELHGIEVVPVMLERWRWPLADPRGARQRGRLKTAAPHAFTPTPARASAQKARVKGRRPRESNTIK